MEVSQRVSRSIDPTYVKRAAKVDTQQLGPYMDSCLMSMQVALDDWRFKGGDGSDLHLAVGAFLALLTEAERRGLV